MELNVNKFEEVQVLWIFSDGWHVDGRGVSNEKLILF